MFHRKAFLKEINVVSIITVVCDGLFFVSPNLKSRTSVYNYFSRLQKNLNDKRYTRTLFISGSLITAKLNTNPAATHFKNVRPKKKCFMFWRKKQLPYLNWTWTAKSHLFPDMSLKTLDKLGWVNETSSIVKHQTVWTWKPSHSHGAADLLNLLRC